MSGSYRGGSLDGILGPKTIEIIRRFQRDFGLPADGAAGPGTLAKLDQELMRRGMGEAAAGKSGVGEQSPRAATGKTRRQALVEEARRHLGAHYLWGTAGARPNEPDGPGSGFKTPSLEPCCFDCKDPSVGVAYIAKPVFKVCRGRWKKVAGGRTASHSDPDLRQYLNEQRGCAIPKAFLSQFTPRAAVDMPRGGGAVRPAYPNLLWGEDCRGVRHFDCIGYVCYCIGRVLGMPEYLLNLSQLKAKAVPISAGKSSYRPQPGDILFRGNQHIAIMGEGGRVLQAQGEDYGVHDEEFYADGRWDHFLRDNW